MLDDSHPGSRALRRGRASDIGRMYLLTWATQGRMPVLSAYWAARQVAMALKGADDEGLSETWAFVVMPDHVHWLVVLRGCSLDALVRRVKSVSARGIHQKMGGAGALWQSGFHDHALRTEEDVRNVARYVIANPQRAGLVEHVSDYPWWDARWLEG